MRKLTKEQKRDVAAIAAKKDADIDFSDIPEVVDWSGAEMGKFYRPPKKSVTMRLDQDVLDWLKAYGRGYQTKVNFLLRHAMMSAGRNDSWRSAGEANRKRSPRVHSSG
ncbi:MAG TPA: BrnA antitoxin family protein [Terriglobales bacterium]|nr:BrnA antitoxin family protein [Terriglobales bacterium]